MMNKANTMKKLTEAELGRAERAFHQTWQAIYYDVDTIEGFGGSNRECVELCVDYVSTYGGKGDGEFMSELYKRIGYTAVIKQLVKEIHLA